MLQQQLMLQIQEMLYIQIQEILGFTMPYLRPTHQIVENMAELVLLVLLVIPVRDVCQLVVRGVFPAISVWQRIMEPVPKIILQNFTLVKKQKKMENQEKKNIYTHIFGVTFIQTKFNHIMQC